MRYKDIRIDSDEEKEKVYDQIHELLLQGESVQLRQHRTDFPAVTVDCGNIHILTDMRSLEAWWEKKKMQERS